MGHGSTVSPRPTENGGLDPLLARLGATVSVRPGIVDYVTRRALLVAAGWPGAAVRCAGEAASIVSMSAAQGFAVHEQDDGAHSEAEGEFRSSSDDHDRVKVAATCPRGTPSLDIRTEG
jgi:hypothetical protein